MGGRVLKVNVARPNRGLFQAPNSNRAGVYCGLLPICVMLRTSNKVWESEEWLRQYVKPLAESGGRTSVLFSW